MSEQPYPDYGLSEETRQMFNPTNTEMKYQAVFHNLIDEICRPSHVPFKPRHAELIAKLKALATDMDLSGRQADWETLQTAIEALGG